MRGVYKFFGRGIWRGKVLMIVFSHNKQTKKLKYYQMIILSIDK